MTDTPRTEDRLRELAVFAARHHHCRWKEGSKRAIAAGHTGHSILCPHPDCVLVRSGEAEAAPVPVNQPDEELIEEAVATATASLHHEIANLEARLAASRSSIAPLQEAAPVAAGSTAPLSVSELDELERRLAADDPMLRQHTRAFALVAIRQLRAQIAEEAAPVSFTIRHTLATLDALGARRGLGPVAAPPSMHRCAKCGYRWDGLPGAEYCGDCHRAALAASRRVTDLERALDLLQRADTSVSPVWTSDSTVAPQPNGWQPIETAPRDGTRVLCWGPPMMVAECEWRFFQGTTGWWRSNQCPQVRPTHWMPLPAPPAASETGGEP